MRKRVLNVGQCQPDHETISRYLAAQFDADVMATLGLEDTLQELRSGAYDLVLVNRKLDRDYSDGLLIIKAIKADSRLAKVPVMLVTNYPEHQDLAVKAGALHGFGKLEYELPETVEKLKGVLG